MDLPENMWYPILECHEIAVGKPFSCERLGLELVLWRDSQGKLHCQLDRCPHLGAALSKGKLVSDRLVCPFHGFEFDAEGGCAHIPANGKEGRIPAGMQLRTFPVCEVHGFVWIWWGPVRADYPEVPFFESLLTGWRYGTVAVDWPTHYTRAIENQLDVAHLAFVHHNTIGAGGRSFVDGPLVEASAAGIKVWVHNRKDDGQPHRSQAELAALSADKEPSLHFLFPGIWKLNIAPHMKNFIAFVPINETTTRYYLRVYHKTRNPLLAWAFEKMIGVSNRLILNQDRRVVITQRPYNTLTAGHEKLIGADRAIAQYRRWQTHLIKGETELPLAQEASSLPAHTG